MRLPRPGLLLTVFILSLLCWVIYYLPARVLVARLPALHAGGAPLQLDQANGSVWQAEAAWHWRGHDGQVSWKLRWHGLTPGVDVKVNGSGLDVAGWIAGNSHRLQLDGLRLTLPLALVLDGQRDVAADGVVSGRIASLLWQEGRIDALKGQLHYTGGNGRWRRQSAVLPVMDAQLSMTGKLAQVKVTDANRVQLASVSVDAKQQLQLQVYRAFADAVGMSEGKGNSQDVILKLTQPLASLAQ